MLEFRRSSLKLVYLLTLAENDGASNEELDMARERYTVVTNELDVAKQELENLKQDFEASLLAKVYAFKQAEDADQATEANKDRINELPKEISSVQDSVSHLKIVSLQLKEDQAKILYDKLSVEKLLKLHLKKCSRSLTI